MNENQTPPQDPFGLLAAGAVSMHEQFKSLVDAGFTEPQAFELVRTMLAEVTRATVQRGVR